MTTCETCCWSRNETPLGADCALDVCYRNPPSVQMLMMPAQTMVGSGPSFVQAMITMRPQIRDERGWQSSCSKWKMRENMREN